MAQVAIHPPSGLRLHQMLDAEAFLASRCKAGHGSSVTVDDPFTESIHACKHIQ